MQVNIPFKWKFIFRIMRLIDNNIFKFSARHFLVQPGSSEVHVPGNNVSFFDQYFRKNIFSSPALVSRQKMFIAISFLHYLFQVIKITAACIGFITHHHAGPLPVAHSGSTAIREQVNINIFRL